MRRSPWHMACRWPAPSACDHPGVDGDQLPHQLLRDASLVVLLGKIRPRQGTAFLVDWRGMQAVLRSAPVPVGGFPACRLVDDVRWLHAFLTRLTALGLAAPIRVPAARTATVKTARPAAPVTRARARNERAADSASPSRNPTRASARSPYPPSWGQHSGHTGLHSSQSV